MGGAAIGPALPRCRFDDKRLDEITADNSQTIAGHLDNAFGLADC
jgi:hypothetical protein